MSRVGLLLCVASAVMYAALGVFGREAMDEGATTGTLLALRFCAAAVLFWVLAVATTPGGPGPVIAALPRRTLTIAIGLGAIGFALQAGLFFSALERIDLSLLSLLLYTFPAIVTVAAIAIGREPADRRRIGALVIASVGLVLVLAGAGTGKLDPLGTTLALGSAIVYSTYILVSDGVVDKLPPLVLSALVASGAAVTLLGVTVAIGDFHPGAISAEGYGWMAALVLIATVGAVSTFFAGLRRVGPSTASIISTVEPPVTLLLAYLAYGEQLGAVQLLGGALVLSAVFVLNAKVRRHQLVRIRAKALAASRGTP